ncbi:hypothetical protein F5J12DRAFT_906882 [Pisolithus orientalis]|uniref:uncharacterized protein n=1 Tax=Pisolithus orientalis TaxID=936130 RepID=UPI0022259ED2|nr:uncharacterized protein F5J12DRAFT_906882 [Pisolithus orientalis]KAI5998403.1 hypothetical protein F5J12DRAFT_906882 [Pisolithus orientalis]
MVGSFHGHEYNCKCQLGWHPTYVKGEGLTEGTCHSTEFHCHQAIKQYFTFWDEDKYATLSQYIYNHYQEAAVAAANGVLNDVPMGNLGQLNTIVTKMQVRLDSAHKQLQNTEALASHFEGQIGICPCCEVGGEGYNQYKEEAMIIKYHTALDDLECLVVHCLFELSKLSMSGTGMCNFCDH